MARIEQRYQGSFTLHTEKGMGGDLVRKAQRVIYGWLVKSEQRYYGSGGCYITKDFYENCRITSKRPGASKVVTSSYYSDEMQRAAWCMSYTHDDPRHAGIDWVTECGLLLRKDTDEVIVTVMLATTTNGEFRLNADEDVHWQVSVPRFVRLILDVSLIKSVSMCGIELPLATSIPEARRKEKFVRPWMNWVKTAAEARKVADIIADPRRRFAVALVMGESVQGKNEVRDLATGLCGKSYVCLLDADWKVAQSFKDYELQFNHVRLILPFYTRKKDKLSRHPMYALLPDDAHKADRERVLESQTGYVTSFEDGAVYRQEDVATLNRIGGFAKKNEAFKKIVDAKHVSDKDAKEMLAYAESVQKDYEEEKKRADWLEKDRDECKALIAETEEECRRTINSLKMSYEGQLRRKSDMIDIPDRLPEHVDGLRLWVGMLTNLEIDDGAWKGMTDRDKPDKVMLAWNMLWHLNSTMHKLVFEERGAEIRKAFKERSGYDYTADENEDVKKKWPEGHKAVVEGQSFMCWRHIKRGNDDKQLVRIYFDFDTARNRIVISWIGKHLRTNLTAAQ